MVSLRAVRESAVPKVSPASLKKGVTWASAGASFGLLGIAGQFGTYTFLGRPAVLDPLRGDDMLATVTRAWGGGATFVFDTLLFVLRRVATHPLQTLFGLALITLVGCASYRWQRRTKPLVIAAAAIFVANTWLLIAPWLFFENVLTKNAVSLTALRIPRAFVTAQPIWRTRVCAEADEKRLYRSVDCRARDIDAFPNRLGTIYGLEVALTAMAALIAGFAWRGRSLAMKRESSPLRTALYVVLALAALMLLATPYVYAKALKPARHPVTVTADGKDYVFYLRDHDGSYVAYSPRFEDFSTVAERPQSVSSADVVNVRINLLLAREVPRPPEN